MLEDQRKVLLRTFRSGDVQRVDLYLSVSAEHQEDYILFHIKEN